MKRSQLGEALFKLALEAHCLIDRVNKGTIGVDAAHDLIRKEKKRLFNVVVETSKRARKVKS